MQTQRKITKTLAKHQHEDHRHVRKGNLDLLVQTPEGNGLLSNQKKVMPKFSLIELCAISHQLWDQFFANHQLLETMPLQNQTRLPSGLSISTAHNSLDRELMMGQRKPQGGRRKRLLRGKARKWKKMHEQGVWKRWGRSKRSAKMQIVLGTVRLGAEAIQSGGAGEAKM